MNLAKVVFALGMIALMAGVCGGVLRDGEPGEPANAYKVWIAESMRRVFPGSRPAVYPTDLSVEISLARNEYESFQVVVLPEPGVRLGDVALSASHLTDGTYVIDRKHIQWHQVGYVKITSNTYVPQKDAAIDAAAPNGAGESGWWPDLLLDVDSFCMDSQYAQPIWVTLYVPGGTPAGEYRGTLTLTTGRGPATVIDLAVRVYPFTLADGAGHYKTSFALREEGFVTTEHYQAYAEFVLEHRLNPDNIYRSKPPRIVDLEHFLTLGMNSFTILNVQYIADNAAIDAFLADLSLSQSGSALRDMAQFYGFDEIEGEKNFSVMGSRFQDLENRYPDIERVTTGRMHSFIPPYGGNDPVVYMKKYGVDRFVPLTVYYDDGNGDALRVAGLEQWSYVCVGPDPWQLPRFANFFTFYPLIESRVIWWQNFHQQMDGFLYYQMLSGGQSNGAPIDPAAGPFIDWVHAAGVHPGDGCLMYAGIRGPIGSVRLANIRDGLEDYEYLWMLEKKTGSRQMALEKCKPVAWGLHDQPVGFTHDAALVRKSRDEIARILGDKKTRDSLAR